MLHYRLHCSCFILFPSVHTSLFMFHLISFSPHFNVHVLTYFLQSTLHCSCFMLFPSVHTSLFMFHLISFSPHFIVHVSSHFRLSTLHCSCFILFPSVPTSLFMFHLISFSPHFIDHVSFLFPSVHSPSHSFHLPQSISFIFTLFGCIHVTCIHVFTLPFSLTCQFHFLANPVSGK